MSEYTITKVNPNEHHLVEKIKVLLAKEGIRLDANLDYICAVLDDDYNVVASGSCFKNTLRSFAVSGEHQGEGLLNMLMSHLMQAQFERGNTHVFLHTKCEAQKFFGDIGFYEIARVGERLVFMENKKNAFSSYIANLEKTGSPKERTAAIVMNANPFTLGHQYLVETACSQNDALHLFVVSEDASLFSFEERKRLVMEGTSHIKNIVYHDTGQYMISSATFPSYFLRDSAEVIDVHARLDIAIFSRIADALGIGRRYVGSEPKSEVTGIYNNVMREMLSENGIECVVVPRKENAREAVSASTVRERIKAGDFDSLKSLLPETSLRYILSDKARPTIERIRRSENPSHY